MPTFTVIGIGADGWPGVPERLRSLIEQADVVVGGARHLAMLPPTQTQTRASWPSRWKRRPIGRRGWG